MSIFVLTLYPCCGHNLFLFLLQCRVWSSAQNTGVLVFSFAILLLCLGRGPSHSFTCRTLQFVQARRGSATNDSDRDNWDWLQTHFVSSVVHRALCVFYRSVTSWHECWRGAILHVGVDKYFSQPRLFCFFVLCLVISVSHLCSPAHLLLIHSVRVSSLLHSQSRHPSRTLRPLCDKLSEFKHFMFKLLW